MRGICALTTAIASVVIAGCTVSASPPAVPATIECRLARGTLLIAADWQLVASAAARGDIDGLKALAGQLGGHGQALMDVSDEIAPQDDVARRFGTFGQSAWSWRLDDGTGLSNIGAAELVANAAAVRAEALALNGTLPQERLEGCGS